MVWAVKHFRHYLYGHNCEVITDHQPLRSLLNTPHPSGRLARWGLALQELNLRITYRPGRQNAAADALSRAPLPKGHALGAEECELTDNAYVVSALGTQSRRPSPSTGSGPHLAQEQQDVVIDPEAAEVCEGQVMAGTDRSLDGSGQARVPKDEDAQLADKQKQDAQVSPMYRYLAEGELPLKEREARRVLKESEQFTIVDEVLFRIQLDKTLRLVVPAEERRRLFDEVHAGIYASHQRTSKIHAVLSKHYWWPAMRKDIERWCKECTICLERRAGPAVKPLLTPIPVGGPFDRVGIDVLQLPKTSRRNQYVLVIADYLTKWVEAYPMKDQKALTIARILAEKFIPTHGVPKEILSDRGANFLAGLMQEFYHLTGKKKVTTTAYHPQTDGLVERFNRTLVCLSQSGRARVIGICTCHLFFFHTGSPARTPPERCHLHYSTVGKLACPPRWTSRKNAGAAPRQKAT